MKPQKEMGRKFLRMKRSDVLHIGKDITVRVVTNGKRTQLIVLAPKEITFRRSRVS